MTREDPRTAPVPVPGPACAGRLSYAVFALARAHRAYAAELLRELGLHPGQELVLMHLLDRDGQTQSELLCAVGLDHSTLSKTLRRMQDAGLLRREPAEHDRRVMRVWLTDEGRATREPLTRMWSSLEEASARHLNVRAAEEFIRASEAIRRGIADRCGKDRAPGPPPAGLA